MNSLIIDGIIIAIVLICIIISSKRGFVRSLVEVAGGILILYFVASMSTPAAEFIYDKTVAPSIISSAQKSIEKSSEDSANKIWKSFPKLVTNNSEIFGITEHSLHEKINGSVKNTEEIAVTAANAVARPIIVRIVALLISIILSILLLILLRFVAKILNRIFSISVLGKINRSLGGILGIIKGIVFSFVFCLLIMFLLSVNKNGIWIFTMDNVNKTRIFKYMYDVLPYKF